MDISDKEAVSVDVGVRLRQLRTERGYSIRELARQSGLSANALSLIERGRTSPSVSTLYKISQALDVPITAFFQTPGEKLTMVFRKAAGRTRVPFTRGLWEGLGGEQFLGHVEPFALTLESGANSGPNSIVHTGHEFVVCLRGQLEYQVENELFQLEAGDTLLFAANLNHRWRNPGPNVTNAIFVLSGFGEGEEPSTQHIAGSTQDGGGVS
ncbi:MAG: helix-turn-helix domain-containing protein [Anaerolineales bacterium]|nr:MAG: helix-turn-helix domain-containing protein [Anaerolineales bacterium]